MKYFLNYAASNPNAEIIFRTSDMLYKIDSDVAYLVSPEAQSQAGGYHYLGYADDNLFNGSIHVLAKIIKTWFNPQLKQKCQAFLCMHNMPSPSFLLLKIWAIHNHLHLYEPTTWPPKASYQVYTNKNDQNGMIWIFIWFDAKWSKNNLMKIGHQAKRT